MLHAIYSFTQQPAFHQCTYHAERDILTIHVQFQMNRVKGAQQIFSPHSILMHQSYSTPFFSFPSPHLLQTSFHSMKKYMNEYENNKKKVGKWDAVRNFSEAKIGTIAYG